MRGNVLFVEDEEALRMTVGDRLRKEGYAVECASNGEEGFEKATQLPFDLVILDVMLPKKSGFDVCREIREAGLITPILMLTARGQTSDKVNGLKSAPMITLRNLSTAGTGGPRRGPAASRADTSRGPAYRG